MTRLALLSLMVLVTILSGCSTIFKGNSQTVTFNPFWV